MKDTLSVFLKEFTVWGEINIHTCACAHTHTHTHPCKSFCIFLGLESMILFVAIWNYSSACNFRQHACMFNHVGFFVTPWTVVHQAPLFKGFSRQEYWSGWPFLTPGKSSWPRDQTCIPCLSCLARGFFTTESPGEPFREHGSHLTDEKSEAQRC